MLGCQAAPAQLFYDICLDDHVPADHLLRGIDRYLELDRFEQLKPFYSTTGRPSIDPELMMRMLIICYSMGIRSERWFIRWRMVLAQHKLNAGETVAAVAAAVGYNSQSAFSHAFKQSFGRTPRWEPTECGSRRADRQGV